MVVLLLTRSLWNWKCDSDHTVYPNYQSNMYSSAFNLAKTVTHVPLLLSVGRLGSESSIVHCQKCRQRSSSILPSSYSVSGSRLKANKLLVPEKTTPSRCIVTTNINNALKKSTRIIEDERPGVITKILDKVGLTGQLKYNRFRIRIAGLNMYTSCADGINIQQFMRHCNMPDTLFSWFLVMELHVWMSMVRLKQEGREGKYMTHYLIMTMWQDLQARGKVMGVSNTQMRDSLKEMVEQFHGALFAYDEGLLSHDRVLASALWRNLFLQQCNDSQQLADVVEYVRQQVHYLEALDSSKLLQVGRIKWLPFEVERPLTASPLPTTASMNEDPVIPEFENKVPASYKQ